MLGAGSVIAGKYRLESPIGKGGMGAVWRATHLTLGRAVAVKMVLGDAPPPETLQRFLREARSLASVRHRNVVDVIDFGEEHGRPFLVMECLDGESLAQRLERTPAPTLAEITEWIAGALGGLAAIHDAGLVHRDLKPANLFLARDADGVIPKVLDFGIARSSEAEGATITHSMQTLGTPHYMSPEQVRSAKKVDARSDLYAMGVILYQALTGRLPFDGPSATAVIAAIVTDDPERVATLRPDLPRGVAELVHRAMARDPSFRFPDARTMRQALTRAAQGHDVDAVTAADAASAPTMPAVSLGSAVGIAPAPAKRTGRRGFFAVLGMLSTILVVGIAGSMTMSGGGPDVAVAPAPMAPTTSPTPAIAPPGAPAAIQPVAPSGTPRFVSAPSSLATLALRARELSAEQRGCVRIAPRGSAWAALSIASCEAHASALRAAFGAESAEGEPDATQLAAALEPVVLRTTTRSNLREGAGPEHALITTLPDETLVVGLYGDVGAMRSEAGGRGTWTRVVAAEGVEGWIGSGLLRGWERCVPRTGDVGGERVVIAWARLDEEGEGASDALVLFEPASSRVRMVRADASCGASELFEVPRAGAEIVEDLFVTRTAAEGGRTLLVVGTRAGRDGRMRWSAYPIGAQQSAWTIELRSGQQLPETRREHIGGPMTQGEGDVPGFWPLRVRRLGGERTWYRWDGATLVPDA
ncbi:serine/threonine protein kinase [Sandaracinus amylolyticus]|uniref:non-specific serine/threonine protein kinase n=1 Tax=Sandaracinus amylolyticus TaxID=927083 RepID=A0A0F6W0U7_9BACT|nr:serine/threonine protein kinase [Sandaracinus amylolyticus]AKF04625.1 serine/threonine protein kinase [Sandaracinus amylolyticus]